MVRLPLFTKSFLFNCTLNVSWYMKINLRAHLPPLVPLPKTNKYFSPRIGRVHKNDLKMSNTECGHTCQICPNHKLKAAPRFLTLSKGNGARLLCDIGLLDVYRCFLCDRELLFGKTVTKYIQCIPDKVATFTVAIWI